MENNNEDNGEPSLMPMLTLREMAILHQLAAGKSDRQIAVCYQLSVKTINNHVASILVKLNAVNRTHAVVKAIMLQLIEPRDSEFTMGEMNRPRGQSVPRA